MKINFFWKGDGFTYLNRLCILSHIGVGHECVMWLSGDVPKSKFWIDDLHITINNADDVVNVDEFIVAGGNYKTASDYWSFSFLYKFGGIYCDTDAVAINHFPGDEWILCSCDPNAKHNKEKLSIGVIAAPKNQEVFKKCIDNIEYEWGNVTVFGNEYEKIYGHTNSTHDDKLFYPFPYYKWNILLNREKIPPKIYSIHLYHSMFERNNKIFDKNGYSNDCMLGEIIKRFDKK